LITHILSKYFKHTLLVLFWNLPSKMHTGERGKRGKKGKKGKKGKRGKRGKRGKGHLKYPLK
jgi:hypothetical protein